MAKEGSAPALRRALVSIAEVVVLPLAPATATRVSAPIALARACARCSTRTPAPRAAVSSALLSGIAEETTMVSMPARCAGSCPISTGMPRARKRSTTPESAPSQPVTDTPRSCRKAAMPDMPLPPIAMKWTAPSSPAASVGASKSKRSLTPHAIVRASRWCWQRPARPIRSAVGRRRAPPPRPPWPPSPRPGRCHRARGSRWRSPRSGSGRHP